MDALAFFAACSAALGVVGLRRRRAAESDASPPSAAFCRALPKVELHAHLSGSVDGETVLDLLRLHGEEVTPEQEALLACATAPVLPDAAAAAERAAAAAAPGEAGRAAREAEERRVAGHQRTLSECFQIFGLIHRAVRTLDDVRLVTRRVLRAFAEDGVAYLELRTTPREMAGCTTRQHIETVVEELAAFEASQRTRGDEALTVRLLISADRSRGRSAADAAVDLAVALKLGEGSKTAAKYVVGVDFSGNPTVSSFVDSGCDSSFSRARAAGLRASVHCGEVADAADVAACVRWCDRGDRLGHALILPDAVAAEVRRKRLPVEVCPTSNVMTLKLPHLGQHPLRSSIIARGHPVSINTDDSGVFATTPSAEHLLAATAFGFTRGSLAQLCLDAVEHGFCDADTRARLRASVSRRSAAALGVVS